MFSLDNIMSINFIACSGGENRQPEISLRLHASMILIGLKNICWVWPRKH